MEKNPQEIINGISKESKDKARLMEIGTLILELENHQKDTRGKEYIEIQKKINNLKKERDEILAEKRGDQTNIEHKEGDYETKKAEIERRRREDIEKVEKEKSVEITDKDFSFIILGTPIGFDESGPDNNIKTNNGSDLNYWMMYYTPSYCENNKMFQLEKRGNSIIYAYTIGNTVSYGGRTGGFFGIAIQLENMYCADIGKLEDLFDGVLNELIVDKYKLLIKIEKFNDKPKTYKINRESFTKKVYGKRNPINEVVKIKEVILKNLKKEFKNDFRKLDSSFNNKIKDNNGYKLDVIDGENRNSIKVKPNYFDFDINEINEKYDAELEELEKKFNRDKEGDQEETQVVENIEEENTGAENDPEDSGWTEGDERELQEIIKRDEEAEAEIAELMKLINELPDEDEEVEEIENESKNESKLTNKEYDKKVEEVEIRRKEEIEKMLESKAVKINPKNFNFRMIGTPEIFAVSEDSDSKNNINFYQNFYDDTNDSTKDFQLIKRGEKIIYKYRLGKTVTAGGRVGGFFGMSIELDNIYCTDFKSLEELLDSVFEKLVIEKFNLVYKTNNPNLPYKFNIKSFTKRNYKNESKNIKEIEEIRNVILYNIQNSLKEDFRNVDTNFNNVVTKPFTRYNLHNISTTGEDVKSIDDNYFDFDRNTINKKYDKELEELKKLYKEKKD
jgi:hypothetical protein